MKSFFTLAALGLLCVRAVPVVADSPFILNPSPSPGEKSSAPISAAQVLSTSEDGTVRISQGKAHPWKLRDRVCLSRNGLTACGEVIVASEAEAIVKLAETTKPVKKGRKKSTVAKRRRKPKRGDKVFAAEDPATKNAEPARSIVATSPPAALPTVPPKRPDPPAPRVVAAAPPIQVGLPAATPVPLTQSAAVTPPPAGSPMILEVGPDLSVSHLAASDSGTGGTASFNSPFNLGVGARAKYSLAPSLSLEGDVGLTGYSFAPTGNGGFDPSSVSLWRTGVGLATDTVAGSEFSARLRFGYAELPIILGDSPSSIELSKVGALSLLASLGHAIYRGQNLSVLLEAKGGAFFSATRSRYVLRNAWEYGGALTASVPAGGGSLDTALYLAKRDLNLSVGTENETSLGLRIVWTTRI